MLSYTAEVLQSLVDYYNLALWPGQLLAVALTLMALLLVAFPRRWGGRAIAVVLAAGWLWVGWVYYIERLGRIDFSAPLYGAAFLLQGLLLLWTGALRGALSWTVRLDLYGSVALLLLLIAVFLLPASVWFKDEGWTQLRLVGLMPLPTVLFTIGMLLLLTAGKTPLHLTLIPLLWSLAASATAWTLAQTAETALAALCVLASVLLIWRGRVARPQAA